MWTLRYPRLVAILADNQLSSSPTPFTSDLDLSLSSVAIPNPLSTFSAPQPQQQQAETQSSLLAPQQQQPEAQPSLPLPTSPTLKRQRSVSDSPNSASQRGFGTGQAGLSSLRSKRYRSGPSADHSEKMRNENGSEAYSYDAGRRSSRPMSNGSSASLSALSSPTKSTNHTKGSSDHHSDAHTNGNSKAAPTGPFFGHDREEVTRILIQSLSDLGYHNAAATLSRESGFELELPSVAAFRDAIQNGSWSEAEALLFGRRQEHPAATMTLSAWQKTSQSTSPNHYTAGLPLSEGVNRYELLFLMRQQKYLEMLESKDIASALAILRQELTPLRQDVARLHTLSTLIMCDSAEELRARAQWDGAAGNSRNLLLSQLSTSISPSVMIPERRLAVLLDQVQEQQLSQCLYHNTDKAPSLYYQHMCDDDDFPLHVYEELREHRDEVWYLEFSHNGSMLATAGKDNKVIVYSTTNWRPMWQFQETHETGTNETGICYISWSPDDRYLLSCSQAKEIVIYDTRVRILCLLRQPNQC